MKDTGDNAKVIKKQGKYPAFSFSLSKADLLLLAFIVLAAFTIRYVSLTGAGVTFDEPIYTFVGIKYIDYLSRLDFSAQSWSLNMEHPPVGKYLYGLTAWLLNGPSATLGALTAAKMTSLLLGVLTCVLVYFIGRDFFDSRTAVAAALILALLPTFVAHTQIAGLESPLVFFATLAMYMFMLAIKTGRRKLLYSSAAVFGLAVMTKFNGVVILLVAGLVFLFYEFNEHKNKDGGYDTEAILKILRTPSTLKATLAFGLIVVMVAFCSWPWLWTGLFAHLGQSVSHWSYHVHEFFLGSYTYPPVYYYLVYFLVTLPVLLFIPLLIGSYYILKSHNSFRIGILAWFLVPFIYGFYGFTQDGIRYIFIIYPAVAIICGYGLVMLALYISNKCASYVKSANNRSCFIIITAVFILYLALATLSVSPYYLDYYNELTGGPGYVQEHKLFETGWWGEGISECMDWVGSTAKPGATVIMLALPEDQYNTQYFMHDQFYLYPWPSKTNGLNKEYNYSREPQAITVDGSQQLITPDYVIYNNKIKEDYNISFHDSAYTVVYRSTVKGAELARVYKRIGV